VENVVWFDEKDKPALWYNNSAMNPGRSPKRAPECLFEK